MSKTTSFALPAIIVIAIAGVVLWPWIMPRTDGHRVPSCLSNVKQLSVALLIYQSDWDERYPHRDWLDSLDEYVKNDQMHTCTEVKAKGGEYGYAMNWLMLGVDGRTIAYPAKEVLLFETDALGNNVAANTAAATTVRHGSGSYVSYADSHAKFIRKGTSP